MKFPDLGSWLVLMVLAMAPATNGNAAKLTDKQRTRIEEPRPAGVPSDAALEAAGAVIGSIDIDVRNIFDKDDPRENNGLYKLADRLHVRTKQSAIRARLLFKSGDKYRVRKVAETERSLRSLSYIYDAHVVPIRYADGKVDIKVITKDVWTLSPGISFGRAGGTNSTSYNLADSNLLGTGKGVQISHTSTVDRTSNMFAYTDPNVVCSHWTAAVQLVDSSDGSERSLLGGQPFYSLDTTWSTKIVAQAYDRTVSRYAFGNIADQFNDDERTYELSGGLSRGLVDGWTQRLLFGMRYDRNVFSETHLTSLPARQLPPDRTLSYPFVGFDILDDKYAKVGDENQIGRTEDVYYGTEVTGRLGWSGRALGAGRDALIVATTVVSGFDLPFAQQVFLNGDFSTRIEGGAARNLIGDFAAKYYWRWRPDWLLYAAFSGTVTDSLDPDMQLLIGGDSGMRGFPLRYESGTSRGLFTLEQRMFTDWYPYRLVRVGAAVFADVGRTWGSGVVGNSDPGLLRDVGFGLRLGNTRSGLGNVLHIDFAFPLNHLTGIQNFQFLVQTFQSF